jgi:Spy/CpxP family protein refolding chaperone
MNKANGRRARPFIGCALSLLFIIFINAQAWAQSVDRAQEVEQQQQQQNDSAASNGARDGDAAGGRRVDPLRALNLSPDQLREIRAIREQNREEWRAVRLRLAEAHRALDEAIYADQINEALIEERAREVGAAQAAVARMRAITELKIRRVMTPEQLHTLRAMREQARALADKIKQETDKRERRRRERLRGRDGNGSLPRQDLDNTDSEPRLRRNNELRGRRP